MSVTIEVLAASRPKFYRFYSRVAFVARYNTSGLPAYHCIPTGYGRWAVQYYSALHE